MRLLRCLLVAAMAWGLVACAQGSDSAGGMSGQTLGTVGGAVLGGVAGSRFGGGTGKLAATAAGTLLGAYLGNRLGKGFDERDQTAAQRAESDALASNRATSWSNPETDHRGTVQPIRTYAQDGRTCRDYTHTIYIDGRAEEARGTACQTADGKWEVVS